ncbi:MAG: hypothetical protein ACPG8W_09455 [Candidatus Promineifilaceae bacterium]
MTLIERSQTLQHIILTLISLGLVGLVLNARNSSTDSDPKLTLLVSQAIVDHGTIALDAYQNDEVLGRPFQHYVEVADVVSGIDRHLYHYFPLGPSIIAVPFVAAARLFGLDMRTDDNPDLQLWLAAGSLVVLLWLLVKIGRNETSFTASTIIATVSIMGSSLTSSMGTAFWSHNCTAVLLGLALNIIIRQVNRSALEETGKRRKFSAPYALLLGLLLFLAFFCRASVAALIAPLLIYLLWRNWRFGLMTAVTSGLLLFSFLAWSQVTFGNFLPPYYSTGRLAVMRQPMWIGVLGNLFSASRGLFVFSPFWLLVPLGLLVFWRKLPNKGWISVLVTWFGLHLFLVARAAKWWGGRSYGPRLMTDVTFVLILLSFTLWRVLNSAETKRHLSSLIATLFLILGGIGIAINSYQGLFNQTTARWYGYILPNSGADPSHPLGELFRWDYAQFLATSEMICDIDDEKSSYFLYSGPVLQTLALGEWLPFRDDEILDYRASLRNLAQDKPYFGGWSIEEEAWRWSACPEARILFYLDELPPEIEFYRLTMRIYALVPQPVTVHINEHVPPTEFWDNDRLTYGEVHYQIRRADLFEFGRNEIKFAFPELEPASADDPRLLGVGFAGLKLEASGTGE